MFITPPFLPFEIPVFFIELQKMILKGLKSAHLMLYLVNLQSDLSESNFLNILQKTDYYE